MLNGLVVGVGGFIGAVCRYLMSLLPLKNPQGFPITTLLVNVIGAFIIGCIVSIAAKDGKADPRMILFLKTGICGGFTTFSTFALETTDLISGGKPVIALVYVLLSVTVGVAAVFAGQYMFR